MPMLVDKLYASPPRITPSFLSIGHMDEWFCLLGFLARTFLHPTSQTSKITREISAKIHALHIHKVPYLPPEHFIYVAIRYAAVVDRYSSQGALVFPSIITLLCSTFDVHHRDGDILGPSLTPVTHSTLVRGYSQALDGGVSVETTMLMKWMEYQLHALRTGLESQIAGHETLFTTYIVSLLLHLQLEFLLLMQILLFLSLLLLKL